MPSSDPEISQPKGEELTPEIVAQSGLVVGRMINLFDVHVEENPFEVVVVGFRSEEVPFGVIIESTKTKRRYILRPKGGYNSGVRLCSEDQYEQALEQTTFGELVPREGEE